jgi:ABC-type Fe3+/spermidine/putrescine transport system ATPase subunit
MKQYDKLQVLNIKKEYEGSPLLKGISLEVGKGEVLCLLGRSGSGKSTLLRIIAGIETAESGQVLWNGEDMCGVPTHLRRFGLMFQDYALFPHLTVRGNIAFGLRMQGLANDEIDRKVNEALERVNLVGFGDRNVTDLSGGEQQRVALARALAPSPRLLMLDEPLAALDRALRAQLQEELREVLHASNIPAIYVTHDQDEALALSDRLALLNEGEIVQSGCPEELYREPRNAWVAGFLGMENLIPGTVSTSEPLSVNTMFGDLLVTAPKKAHFKPGSRVTVVMLSLDAELTTKQHGQNILRLSVAESLFKGDHFRTVGLTKTGEKLVFNLKSKHKNGEVIAIHLPQENWLAMTE